jgi:sugar/nucleoside kinase (ribokinase family)
MYDIITIGGATQDIFAESDGAKIFNIETISSKQSYLCFDYGAKIEMDKMAYDIGGGASNAAVNFSNLDLKTAAIVKVGKDLTAEAILQRFKEKNIDSSMVIQSDCDKTGYSMILISYEGDRTVLMYRGANSTIKIEEIDLNKIKQSKWVYIASLSGASNQILDKIAEFAEDNGVNMAFNPGTAQLKRGTEDLRKVLEKAEILIMNRDEASIVTGIPNNPPDAATLKDENLKEMVCKIHSYGSKIVVITEGKRGAYAYDGQTLYHAPIFPSEVVSTLGAGDAFASTFTASMIKFDDIEKALKFASINSASVVKSFGAQTGLLPFAELEEILNNNSDYKILKQS